MNLYNILNQLVVLRTWLWLPKSVKEISWCASIGVHSILILFMIWLHHRPIQLIIAPAMNHVPVMCVEEQAIAIKEAVKTVQQNINKPLLAKKAGLKEPPLKKVVPKKKQPVKKIVPKKEVVKPVVKKEIKLAPEPEKKIIPVIEQKVPEVMTIQLGTPDSLTEIGTQVHNSLQSAWRPPLGIVPTKACVVCITLKSDGTIKSLLIEQSSGIAAYDLAAKAAIAKTVFPKPLWNRSIRFSFI